MDAFICVACGVQQAPTPGPPARCPICEDERQYVRRGGQAWTTLAALRANGHRIEIRDLDPGIVEVSIDPRFGIGQRALLLRTPHGNFLWDSVGYIDDQAVETIKGWGGIAGIAMSHPHFYGVTVEWSNAFGGAPIYIPEADAEWMQREDPAIQRWSGTLEVLAGLTLLQCGGHFEGSAVMHWAGGADGEGALLVGDTISVVADPRYVTFMRSYPNYIPLPSQAVRGIVEVVRPYRFDRIYGAWRGDVIPRDAKAAVERSAARYLEWIGQPEA